MFGHTTKAYGYSLRNNKPQLPKTSITGSLTKSNLLLKCLAICCVFGSVGATAAERVSLVANVDSSPTSTEFTDLQAKVSVHDENKEIATLRQEVANLKTQLEAKDRVHDEDIATLQAQLDAVLRFVGMTPPSTPPSLLRCVPHYDALLRA